MPFPPGFLDELRARLPVSEVVARRVPLTRGHRGEFKACCPFHKEKTPSFTVNDPKGFFHCFAGETGVLTWNGTRPIRELAGGVHRLLTTGGAWIDAPIRSFGEQRLWRLDLSRNGVQKSLFATEGHRWFIRSRISAIETRDLKPGHRLEAVFPKPLAIEPSPEGIRHGIVFGDGYLTPRYAIVNLHGAKGPDLRRWFEGLPQGDYMREGGEPYVQVRNLAAHYKALPSLDADPAYLAGFIAGHLATDGHVATDGTVMLHCGDRNVLDFVRTAAMRVGIGSHGVTTQMRTGYGDLPTPIYRIHFVTTDLSRSMVLRAEARSRFVQASKKFGRHRWQVRAVSPTDRVEEVFCAQVPETGAFALEDNILTGNCFGCGAHGDVIGFVMQHDRLSFPDAVEMLAGQAGLEVPQSTPEERERFERRRTLYDVVESACTFFEAELRTPAGRAARGYFSGRGLDEDAIARFRLGYAPADGARLLKHLRAAGFEDGMIQEAGLARKPDDGREAWAFFRNRVTFPVGDKRGRIVAFGARLMEGEGPKYINSPDGPLFHKGQLLYGMARAAQAAGDGQPLIVAEGYMDVIALVRAGFEGAVAPLGTAVTEEQIEALWGMAPVPVLCFDGDNAGRRAAWRAIDRILPRLRPDHSARIAFLPEGEDPDSLIRARGGAAMQGVLEAAVPLAQLLFEREMTLHQIATPEGRAGLKAALEARARGIADIAVQYAYRRDLRDRFDAAFPWKPQMKGGKPGAPLPGRRPSGLADDDSDRTALAILIVALAHHPDLFDEYGEALALLHVDDPALERARERVHERLTARVRASRRGDNPESDQALDPAEVRHHLTSHTGAGLSEAMVGRIERKWRVGPSVPIETARDACHVVLASVETRARRREVAAAAQALKDADSDADVVRWKMLNPESDLASGGGGR